MEGFLLIDKPLWITSFDVLRQLKKKLNMKKMWHTWTLDPLASGCLLVALWNYTKLIPYFEKDYKEYEFTINLDWYSESFDLWTDVVFLSQEKKDYYKNTLTLEHIQEIIDNSFTWKINQMPPKYSALKIWWKKAIDMVRNGVEFDLKSRDVVIDNINILDFSYPQLKIRAFVSAGTYIRSIASDLWEILWTWWYISYLRRTKIWHLDISASITLDDISDIKTCFLNEEIIFNKNTFITLDDYLLDKINNWIKQTANLDLEENIDYFVLNKTKKVTNIIQYSQWKIIPIRKI